MKKSIAMKWIEALRSGKYRKTTGTLERDNEYCCLGVLCKIAPNHLVVTAYYSDRISGISLENQTRIKDWAGLKSNVGFLDYSNSVNLADLNDSGYGFKRIANIIEKNWRKL